jgi:hypothetical protein
MRLISYQAIIKLKFPRKDLRNGNLNGKLFWNQVWKTKNFKPNVKLIIKPNVKLKVELNVKLRTKSNE